MNGQKGLAELKAAAAWQVNDHITEAMFNLTVWQAVSDSFHPAESGESGHELLPVRRRC